ncbi:MAG: hypothetical protein Q8N47_16685 [Bryobacterales bacterium]|nr:hypothetical protein [Bryobacterales bacterium]
MTTVKAVGYGAGGVDEPEVRAQIERVCTSQEFHRSEQCKRFLTFVCDLALQGNSSQINEYSIGVDVFHRAEDYSPAEDAVVRRQAHVLRRKLDAYYANEGRTDKVLIEIPVGRYVPIFCLRALDDRSGPQPSGVAPRRNYSKLLTVAAAAVALAGASFLAGRLGIKPSTAGGVLGAPRAAPKQVEEIWGPWFRDPAGVTICFANSKTAVVHRVPDPKLQDPNPEHFRPDAGAERGLRQFFQFPPGGYLFYRPTEMKTGVAESISAVNLAQLFGRYGVSARAKESRLLNWGDLRNGSFILLGHNEANPWVDKLLHNYPFRLGDGIGSRRYIENTKPAPGEKPTYFKEAAAASVDPVIEYGLVSMLPGLDDRHMLLLIAGLDGQASQMASEFLSQPARLEQLASRLRRVAPGHAGPWYFQFILRAEVRERLATRADIVALRVLSP